jgi:osmotically-inducible protein OsmY
MIRLLEITHLLLASMRVPALCVCMLVASGCAGFGTCGLRECSDDAKITAEVRTLLAKSPELGGANPITVQTVHGVVYLRGLVSTPYQISAAGGIAEGAPGVIEVQNLLNIDNSH